MHPHLTEKIAECMFELGWLAEERGDLVEARSAFAVVKHERNLEEIIARGYVLMLDRGYQDAAREMVAVFDEYNQRDHIWPRFRVVDALFVVAHSQLQLGLREDALATLRRALTALEGLTPLASTVVYQRRLARVRATLARVLANTDAAAAKQLANIALAWYRKAGGYDAVVKELEAITGSPN
jgi:hypothetical protein